jgi:hypothetical protein
MTRRTVLLAVLLLVFVASFFVDVDERVEGASPRALLADDPLPPEPRPRVEGLVDSRTVPTPQPDGTTVEFEVDNSSAVVRLDVHDIRSDESELLRLYPDFASAARAVEEAGARVLPSLNVLDAKAKQVEDGLMAALERHLVLGSGTDSAGGEVVALLRDLRAALASDAAGRDAAADWLTAALALAGSEGATAGARRLVDAFEADPLRARPIGFHTWSGELERTFRTLRFLQQPLASGDPVRVALEAALAADDALRARYERVLTTLRLATNRASLPALGAVGDSAALLPASVSRELELLTRLYPTGVPEGADTLAELVLAIQSGRLDLAPREGSGWLEQRMFAFEVFLLPERADEHEALVLTRRYKQRLVEAYRSRVVNVLETHVAGIALMAARPPQGMEPRLRVEPCATYAARMATSFAFVEDVLARQAPELLDAPGLAADGVRVATLRDELAAARRLFEGVHLVVCEDLGLAPRLPAGALATQDHAAAREAAAAWLAAFASDPDLAVDARVVVPIGRTRGGRVRVWGTTGVSAVRLSARYVHTPHVRPRAAAGAEPESWQTVEPWHVQAGEWILLVERSEELSFDEPPTRDAYRRFLEQR